VTDRATPSPQDPEPDEPGELATDLRAQLAAARRRQGLRRQRQAEGRRLADELSRQLDTIHADTLDPELLAALDEGRRARPSRLTRQKPRRSQKDGRGETTRRRRPTDRGDVDEKTGDERTSRIIGDATRKTTEKRRLGSDTDRPAGGTRTRVICPSCTAESFVQLDRQATDHVLCSCGAKINISLEKYALRGRVDAPKDTYPRMLGPHKLIRLLGQGGSATVHLGIDPLGRQVAVKELRGSKRIWQRALREAECTIRCACLNVVNTYEIREADRVIVQEYVEGETLRRAMVARSQGDERAGAYPPEHAVDLLLQVLHGLQVCHIRGVIHLDIKPENILLESSTGLTIPKLTDFGVARNLNVERERTASGDIVLGRRPDGAAFEGTPSYSAPEQFDPARKHLISRRTDIYQAGVLFYELLTGRLPFPGRDWRDIFTRIMRRDIVPLRKRNRALPDELVQIQERMQDEEAEHRYASVGDIIQDLEAWRASRSFRHLQQAGARLQRIRLLVALAVGLGFGGSVGVLVTRQAEAPLAGPGRGEAERAEVPAERVQQAAGEVRELLELAGAARTLDGDVARARSLMRVAEERLAVLEIVLPFTREVVDLRAELASLKEQLEE
jgi:serine/threonine-protein kinase